MIPKISIQYNRFLDPIFVGYIKAQPQWKDWERPTDELIKTQVLMYKSEWDKYGERILKGMCDATGLSFKRNEIDVFVVSGNPRSFSRPIVVKSRHTAVDFIDVVAHELIHCLYSDNPEKVQKKFWYPHEDEVVKLHVYLMAILKYIYIDVLQEPQRLEASVKKSNQSDSHEPIFGYRTSWDLVNQGDYRALLEEFKLKLK